MNTLRESTGVRVPSRLARCGVVLLAAMGLLVSACGSGDEQSSPGAPVDTETTAPVAGAQENAVGSGAVCFDWPDGTVAKPCAVGLKGPGGGRVFYDAGSEQPWGRFLEVAPQNWGGTLYDCKSCGAAGSVTAETSDRGNTADMTTSGYFPCHSPNQNESTAQVNFAGLLPGEAADTLWEIGGGRHNTEVLSQASKCVDGSTSALTLATGYRGGDLSDWYLPSGGELTELCKYTGRSAIGGFLGDSVYSQYVSSTVGPTSGYTNVFAVDFAGKPLCEREVLANGQTKLGRDGNWHYYYQRANVRPIRAFA